VRTAVPRLQGAIHYRDQAGASEPADHAEYGYDQRFADVTANQERENLHSLFLSQVAGRKVSWEHWGAIRRSGGLAHNGWQAYLFFPVNQGALDVLCTGPSNFSPIQWCGAMSDKDFSFNHICI
jgi:hypothetical protein